MNAKKLTPEQQAAADANMDKLPELCFAVSAMDPDMLINIKRGVIGYYESPYPVNICDMLNDRGGVTPQQKAAMQNGSLFGWHLPCADPDGYDEEGRPLIGAATA